MIRFTSHDLPFAFPFYVLFYFEIPRVLSFCALPHVSHLCVIVLPVSHLSLVGFTSVFSRCPLGVLFFSSIFLKKSWFLYSCHHLVSPVGSLIYCDTSTDTKASILYLDFYYFILCINWMRLILSVWKQLVLCIITNLVHVVVYFLTTCCF